MNFSARLASSATFIVFIAACTKPFSDAPNRFAQGDYRGSVRGLIVLADQGDPEAQVDLGYLHQYGIGAAMPQDEAKALHLFQKAEAQGYAPAKNFEGVLYVTGSATPHDYSRAVSLFEAGVAAGDPLAKWDLADMYAAGLGVPQDPAKSKALFAELAGFHYPAWERYTLGIRACVESNRFYPREAAQQRRGGIATVSFSIDRLIATDVHIVKSSGSPDLDTALVQTVESCIFPYPPPGIIPPKNFQLGENFSM